jgi:hypothetical protein
VAYFEELEFEPELPEGYKPTIITTIDETKLKSVLDEIDEEMSKIKLGVSDLTHYAIDSGTFASPVGDSLKRLKTSPSIKTIKDFIELTKQDLGAKASTRFAILLSGTVVSQEEK